MIRLLITENLVFSAFPYSKISQHTWDIQRYTYRTGRSKDNLTSREKELLSRYEAAPSKVYFLPGSYKLS